MKTTKLTLLSLLIAMIATAQENPYQAKIDSAFGRSFATQQNQIEPLLNELKEKGASGKYWLAYAHYYSGIYYLQTEQKDKAEASTKKAIALLQNDEEKDAEDHALLGYVLGFSITFNPSSAVKLSSKAAREYKAALKKDENNLRAYLGLGVSDFHKPKQYGGGEKVEEYLLKALSLPVQSKENGPSWGKNTAYHTLASFYKREGQIDKAKMYCMKGLNEFPQDHQLNQLKASF